MSRHRCARYWNWRRDEINAVAVSAAPAKRRSEVRSGLSDCRQPSGCRMPLADECMARGIANRIRLGLDDPTAGSRATVIANQHFPNEKARQLDRILRQLRATQSAKTVNRG